ncbi:hypothetical protein [Hufsiella ginkgonis]|uniref:Macroglobulin domain-containing protein n=1 Tax=Hufsiella ginkgonis TaxID=2695274 RepID=A0A7K1XVW8_9SPHI|nr:hypothetical protein [Hufsiella ginkgonis]MXV15122.1 hypothetical protein [Hufsiella ginkgonis]
MRVFRPLYWLLLMAAFTVTAFVIPENPYEKLKRQLLAYQKQNPTTCLFLHTDKNRYAPNEDVWFKAYILSGNVIDNEVLYVRLTDQHRRIILTEQFPVYDIRAHGDILLPDTLKDGNYYLFAYTDRMINFSEEDVFMQPITVTRNSYGRLEAEASVIDTTRMQRGEKIDILVKVRQGEELQRKVRGQYYLMNGDKEIKNGRITTNDLGEATISFVYPPLPDDKSLQVRIRFDREGEQANLDLNLRHESNPVKLQAFPEGGHLIAGAHNRLVVTAMDINRVPVSTTVKLMNNGQEMAAVTTDKYGLGSIDLVPALNAVYSLSEDPHKLITPVSIPVEPSGYALVMQQDEDATDAMIYNRGAQAEALLVIRTYDSLAWKMPVTIPPGKALKVNMPLEDLPKGMLSLAIFDGSGRAVAERLFMNKRNEDDYHVVMKTDQPSYGVRKKVTVSLNITNREKEPVAGNVSIAVIERGRLDQAAYRTILDYYDSRFLDKEVPFGVLAAMSDKTRDELLIAKSWQRNSWNDITSFVPGEPATLLRNTGGINGYLEPLTRRKKKEKLKDLVIYSKGRIGTVPVNGDYTFSISAQSLLSYRGNEFTMVQGEEFLSKYKVHFDDYDLAYDKKILEGATLRVPQAFSSLARNKLPPALRSSLSKGIQLAEIRINAGAESGGLKIFRSTTCNDYVCANNILNCSNHINAYGNFLPREGAIYSYRRSAFGSGTPTEHVVYRGCGRTGNTSVIKNISIPKQFFLPDYEKQPSYEPELRTTIYWNPNSGTTRAGVNAFSFFTSDIRGDFIVVAQGLDVNTLAPLYGTAAFTVK